MTMSKLASKYIPAAHHYGRRTAKVCKITPHHMAGDLTIEGCGAVFQTRQASSNYGIGSDGRIACYVDEDCGAWTSSSYWNDNQAITIEVANSQAGGDWPVSAAAWKSLVNLCADICKRYGFKLEYTGGTGGSLTEHRMFDATACPGPYLHARMSKLAKEVNARVGGPFTDVDESTPHHEDIKWLKDKGIAKGYADGSYRPSAPLTRADCATFLHRLAGTRIFTDVADDPDIAWMAVKGIAKGFPDGSFRPSSPVTRADFAEFLYRMAGEPEFADSSSFEDVDDATPHARAIRWLGSTGIAKGYGDGTYKPMAYLTRGDAAAFMHRAAAYVK